MRARTISRMPAWKNELSRSATSVTTLANSSVSDVMRLTMRPEECSS